MLASRLVIGGFLIIVFVASVYLPQRTLCVPQELQFWNPQSWTWDNFIHWDWTKNVQKVIDVPIDGFHFWIHWIKHPRIISQEEVWTHTVVYLELVLDNFLLYEKGVAMQIQGLWLQHKYDQAFKRLMEHLFWI